MRKTFERLADISIRQISAQDWETYSEYWKGLSAPAHFSGIMRGQDLDEQKTYEDLFEAIGDENVMLGLWDKDKLIGQTGIFFDDHDGEEVAMFQGSEIADEYRGFGFSKNLYEARMRHLKQIGYEGKIITSIREDNEPSMRAAQRNGFIRTDVSVHDKIILERPGVDLKMI